MKRTEKVIDGCDSIILSLCDKKMLADALVDETVREPNDFLISVVMEYKVKVESYLTGKM